MTDPSPVPWELVWLGCLIAVAGAIVAMSGWGQREPRRMDVFGKWIVGCGAALMFSVLLINGVYACAHAFGGILKSAIASAQPSPEMQAPTR
jgi:uncharacterized membrane protein AbrB (regulator of aidB expression)